MDKKILGFFLAGLVLLSIGFYLGHLPAKNNTKLEPSITPSQKFLLATPASLVLGNKSEQKFRVLKIIDGDTINVDIDGRSETIRLIGIDTPEAVDPRKPVQCFGKEASDKAKELLSDKSVILKKDETQGERDKYDRLLRYVFLEDGTNFNKLMISEGYAHEYTYKNKSNCAKTCSQIVTCEEAYFQLNQCGCSKRDADSDGVPCESLCR